MSPKLPVISGKECINVLHLIGYQVVRQKGSHIRLMDQSVKHSPITVPDHKELRPGLLKKIIKDAGLTVEEFEALRDK